MIYRKSRLGIRTELGSRNQLMQNNGYDDPALNPKFNNKVLPKPGSETDIQDEILIDAVGAMTYNQNGLGTKVTKEELNLLERLDNVLDKVDLVVDKQAQNFYFADDSGARFTMPMGSPKIAELDPHNLEGQEEILDRAYRLCAGDHKLTKKEIELIEKIDSVLPNADITINPQTGDASIISNKGGYDVPFPKGGRKR